MEQGTLVHATAIVAGTFCFLFVGPSGSGKTRLALGSIDSARRSGRFAALVADDQVLISRHGKNLIARCPTPIKGKAEIRGAGIVGVETVDAAKLDFAVRATDPAVDLRMASALEHYTLAQDAMLPLLRLPIDSIDPWANLQRIMKAYLAEK